MDNPKDSLSLEYQGAELETLKISSFLVNVLSHMEDQFAEWKQQHPLEPAELFPWQPQNPCPITQAYKLSDFHFGRLIFSDFILTDDQGAAIFRSKEPFGCIVTSAADGSRHLVYRSSKSLRDFIFDAKELQFGMSRLIQMKPDISMSKKDFMPSIKACARRWSIN